MSKVTIIAKGKEIELTFSEAKVLYKQLYKLFSRKPIINIVNIEDQISRAYSNDIIDYDNEEFHQPDIT